MKDGKRRYEMKDRAATTRGTRERIIEAALELSIERSYEEITMRSIARAAGVAPQTVVNHFGSKEGLVAAGIESGMGRAKFLGSREEAPVGDIAQAVELLVDDYERVGNAVMQMFALEDRLAAVKAILDEGRLAHRQWVEQTFPAALAGLSGVKRERRLDLLACATDIYIWKLLRRDRELNRAQVVEAIEDLVGRLHQR